MDDLKWFCLVIISMVVTIGAVAIFSPAALNDSPPVTCKCVGNK